jgi:pyrroloquinoline quinone biosynthesis protein A
MQLALLNETTKEIAMWTKPQATEMRFGFEVTMYVCNR